MRVAVLVTHWKNTQGTGVTRYVINLTEELRHYPDVDVRVIYRYGKDSTNRRIRGTKFTFPLKALPVLFKYAPDVVYVDTNWYFLATGVIYKKIKGAKLIATMHSHPSKLPHVGNALMKYLLNSCDSITYVSKSLRDAIHRTWLIPIDVKEEITYAGVRTQPVNVEELNEFINGFKIPEKSFILLMQSSPIAKVKADGTKILMRSVRALLSTYPSLLLIITGNGPYLDDLRRYARDLDIQDHVIFTGWIDNPFIPLALCDIYTHISLGEGLPLALLEAMSLGKPIIATSVGGIPEVIDDGKNGLLVEPDAKSIAKSISAVLLDEKLRKSLGENAHIDSKKYTWDRCADRFMDIFEGRLK